MACKRQTKTNKSDSILFDKLYEISDNNEFKAEDMYTYFQSKPFIEGFGDWITAYENAEDTFYDRVDENGEPKLFYNEVAKRYYFINQNGEQIFYPLVEGRLRNIFDYKQLRKIVSQLALSYFTANTKYDFSNINFEEDSSKLPNLRKFIENKINSKIEELQNSDDTKDYFNSMSLEDSLNYLDEWVDNIDAFYKKIGLKRNDNLEDSESIEEIEEDVRDPAFNKPSFERDTKDAISTNIKLRLALLKDESNVDPIWNEPTFVSFDDIYSTLLKTLSNQVVIPINGEIEDIFDIYKSEIEKVAVKKPYFNELLKFLNSPDFTENNKNEFTQAFNLHRNNFLISELKQGKFTKPGEREATEYFKHTIKSVSNSGDKASRLVSEWGNNFKNLFLNEDNSFKENSNAELKALSNKIEHLKKNFKGTISQELFTDTINEYIEILDQLGIETTEVGFNYYLEDDGNNQFDFEQQSSKLLKTINDTELALKKVVKASVDKVREDSFVNPLESQSIFKNIAKSEAFFISEGSDASIRTGGKSKWLYSYPSYLSTKILQWKKNPSLLEDLYNRSEYNKGSYLMKWLLGLEVDRIDSEAVSKSRIKNFDLGIFNTLQEENGNSESANEISFNDYFTDHVNKVLSNNYSRTTTPADKTTDYQLRTGFFENSFGGFQNGEVVVNENTLDIFFEYFNSEFNRMKEASLEIEAFKNNPENLTVHYHYKKGSTSILGNAFKSQYFPDLSFNSTSKDPLVIQIKTLLYDDNGLPRTFSGVDLRNNPIGRIGSESFRLRDLLEQYISRELSSGIKNTGNIFRDQNLIKYNEEGNTVNNLINTVTYNKYNNDYKQEYGENGVIGAIISDFYINSLIQNIEYSKMFSGDVAFYKDMVDYKKRIPATYTDGLQLRLKPGEENFTIASLNSIEIPTPFLDKLREMVGADTANKYDKINAADAQAWITPKRWKFLVERLGKWTPTHNSLYSKMISDVYEPFTLQELKIAAQPLKGVYFELNGKVPTYLKYSQAVLTKNLIKDSGLQKVYDQMIKQGVDELITIDGIKVGSPTPTTIHDKNGNVVDDIKFNIRSVKNSGWKLQQDLPTKTFKDTEVGSQIQKNIFGGLKFNTNLEFELDNQIVNGQTIIDELTEITKALSNKGLESIKREFKVDNLGRIRNVRGFYNSLVNELERRGGSQNVIDALRKEITLYGIPQAGSKIINVFASVMTNRLIKIKTNGGSFIQMSNFGLNKTEGDKQGVIWSPDADSTTNEPYLTVNENGRTIVKPGGILLSGSFIAKYIPDYRKYTPEQLFNEIIDKKITENLIGYRIPNQGLASNDALRIVGILPEENGDTIVAYTGITTKTGSDYDIDKMYIMMPSYKLIDGKLTYLEDLSTIEGLQNRLIELYKAVLTNTEVIKDVMKPIDIDFIKNEILNLYPAPKEVSLSHFDSYNDIQLLYDFRGGKAGVGQEANAVVDINRLGELSLNNVYIGWGHQNAFGNTLFDNEYSVKLAKQDLDYYISEMKPKDVESFVNEIEQVKIADSLTAILNAFVDIAKDPYITRGNWVTSTTNTGNLMLRAGMHPLYVTNFMAQPIIKDFIDYQSGLESIIGNNSGDMKFKFRKNIAVQRLKIESENFPQFNKPLNALYEKTIKNKLITYDELSNKLTQQSVSKFFGYKNPTDEELELIDKAISLIKLEHIKAFDPSPIDITSKSLKDFRDQIKNKPDTDFQNAILDKFFQLQELSKNLRENIDVSKVDTNGMGKNIGTLFGVANLRQFISEKSERNIDGALLGFESKFDNTVLGVYYNNGISEIIKLVNANPELFPQGQMNVQNMFNEISQDLYGTPTINESLATTLEEDYYSYNLAYFFDLTKEESIDLLYELPKRFEEFRKVNRNKYVIIDELEIKQGDKDVRKFIGLNNRKKSSDFEDIFTDSWRDLLIDNPKLGEDLIKYSYLTSGFKMSPNQFFTYIPNEYFVENGINNFIKEFTTRDQLDFIDKFYLNNSTNNKFVPRVFESDIESVTENSSDYKNGFINLNPDKIRYYVSYNNDIYKLEGFDNLGNAMYSRVLPLGYDINGNKVVEYGTSFTNESFVSKKSIDLDNYIIELIKNSVVNPRNYLNLNNDFELQRESKGNVVEPLTIESLWNKYSEKILEQSPNESIELLYMLELDMGINNLAEYLKKCY